jgi:DNA mismatch repair protein MSH4
MSAGEAKYEKRHAQRQLQCLFAVKAELSGSLQTHRETLCDLTLQMEDVLEMYRRDGSLHQLKLNYSQRRGYHFTLPASDRHLAVEQKFIHIQQMSKKTVGCSTEKLSQINSRCRDVIQKILACTTKLIGELVEELQKKLHVLFQLSESVALLDMLASFATHVRESGSAFARPTIGESDELVLKASRHPLLERLGEHSAVPNDAFMTPACNTQLITGPNMAGKSTYLRQVALVRRARYLSRASSTPSTPL